MTTLCFAQSMLPVSIDIMRELQIQYRSGETDLYLERVIAGREITEDQRYDIEQKVQFFFDSDQFLETGAQYLTALFTERDLEEILMVLRNPSLANDPNYQGAVKLNHLMNRLKPYLVQYLRHRT